MKETIMAKQTKKTESKKSTAAKKTTPAKKTTTASKKPTAAEQTTTPELLTPEIIRARLMPVKKPDSKGASTKRPPSSPTIPYNVIFDVIDSLVQAKADLEAYAAHLRALDRKRLHSIGVRKEGFAQRAFRLAMDNPEFLPNYLAAERYIEDYNHYVIIQSAVDLNQQVRELLLNIDTEAMDYFYTDGLDFYASVREASNRRVDAAESIHAELKTFFKKTRSPNAPETKKQQERDVKGIIRGTKDGKFEAENIKPHMTGGKHEVIDEQFKDTAKFRDEVDGELED